ncbi:MAG: glycine cleavage T C-terminal barrel domain-containing protein [Myxococcota bacterium]|nr:glycine cleavage T C-terminal barrel domain-containing protein [Myxococcota bacterium]
MRTSPIRVILASRGARFAQWGGVEVAAGFTSFEAEYSAVRNAVGLTDFSFTSRFKMPEAGLDMLETYAAGSVASIRFGRVLHTFAADENGFLESDLYIANDDEELIVIGENLIDDRATRTVLQGLGAEDAGIQDISESTALFGLDGFQAFAVARDLFGSDILGLPYLSIETYELEGVDIKVIRGGKTSEFGYLLLVPAASAAAVWERIEAAGAPHGLEHIGADTHLGLRLDGRFFCIYSEGAAVRDPLPLGLQWMIDFSGDDFRGRAAIMARRAAGLETKVVGVMPVVPEASVALGGSIYHQGERVAKIVAASHSPTLGHPIGLALFDATYAYAGLTFEDASGAPIQTVSMPPFTPKSLTVKLEEM